VELERNPKIARRMIAGLSQRVENLVLKLDRQALGSGTERFVAYLLRHGRGETTMAVTLPAAKGKIASQLILTPEHFSRTSANWPAPVCCKWEDARSRCRTGIGWKTQSAEAKASLATQLSAPGPR
jgi:hypothetical protein